MKKSRKQTEWTKLVTRIFDENKSDKNFKLKNAMELASKEYHKVGGNDSIKSSIVATPNSVTAPSTITNNPKRNLFKERTGALQRTGALDEILLRMDRRNELLMRNPKRNPEENPKRNRIKERIEALQRTGALDDILLRGDQRNEEYEKSKLANLVKITPTLSKSVTAQTLSIKPAPSPSIKPESTTPITPITSNKINKDLNILSGDEINKLSDEEINNRIDALEQKKTFYFKYTKFNTEEEIENAKQIVSLQFKLLSTTLEKRALDKTRIKRGGKSKKQSQKKGVRKTRKNQQ